MALYGVEIRILSSWSLKLGRSAKRGDQFSHARVSQNMRARLSAPPEMDAHVVNDEPSE